MENRVKILFEDWSLRGDYELLDYGKNKSEMEELAKKRGIKVPSKDLAIFKCKYAMVDKQNLNGCILPKKEVEKALDTLNGKAIDKDHLRQNTIGHWLDTKLDKKDIVAYGCFFKSNFPEDYEEIKNRMKEGKMKISFEAWGNREFNKDGSYNLTEIEFAGGALLFDTEPAFPDAEVLDFSSINNRVLEFAKIIDDPTESKMTIKEMEDKIKHMEDEMMNMDDEEEKKKMMMKITDMKKKMKEMMDESNQDAITERKITKIVTEDTTTIIELPKDSGYDIERKSHTKRTVFYSDNSESVTETDNQWEEKYTSAQVQEKISKATEELEEEYEEFFVSMIEGDELMDEDNKTIEESKKLTYKERKSLSDDDFAVVVTIKNKITGKPRKIRMFPIKDPAHVKNALARLPQATETLKKLGVSVEEVKKKILKRARELNMTDLLKRHKEEANTLMDELLKKYNQASVEELVKFLDKEIDTFKATLATKDQEIATLKTEKDAMIKTVEDSKILVENSKLEVEKVKAELASIKAELDKRINAEKAAIIKSRKDELGEYAKDVSDEDILNDLKFENTKLKKERDEALKKAGITVMNAGQVIVTEDETTKKQKRVQAKAWEGK